MADANDEEFQNFMYKVNQVSSIVQKLSSNDKDLQDIGDLEAKEYLGECSTEKEKNLDENTNVELKTIMNKTLLNRKAIMKEDNPNSQSQEAFMEEVSKDADKRFKDKLKRKERMETLKKQANLAFRRGEFEKALCLYNKAIEQIRDTNLYCNRALTYINLKLPERAIADCEMALKVQETSLRAKMLLAKAYYLQSNSEKFQETIDYTKTMHPRDVQLIEDFAANDCKLN